MVEGTTDTGNADFLSLAAGDKRVRDRLARGERLRVQTPFRYPGRRGTVVLDLIPGAISAASGSRLVRISDDGGLIKSLDEQGMDLSIDMVVSKTVVHAVKEVEGAGVGSGEVYLDSTADMVATDVWRFLQLVNETHRVEALEVQGCLTPAVTTAGKRSRPDRLGRALN